MTEFILISVGTFDIDEEFDWFSVRRKWLYQVHLLTVVHNIHSCNRISKMLSESSVGNMFRDSVGCKTLINHVPQV